MARAERLKVGDHPTAPGWMIFLKLKVEKELTKRYKHSSAVEADGQELACIGQGSKDLKQQKEEI